MNEMKEEKAQSADRTSRAVGHTSQADTLTSELMWRFNQAFQRHDPDALTELVAEDCVIENTGPAPNGSRHVGRRACLAVWQGLAGESGTHFEPEEVFVAGDRAIIRWRYFFGAGESNSLRGVNLMRVRDGQIIEAMGYVKSRRHPAKNVPALRFRAGRGSFTPRA